MEDQELAQTARRSRRRLLRMHHESRVGHLGGNLSALDVLLHLHHRVLQPEDVFVLAKGHAAGALYVTLWSLGELDDDDLRDFHRDGTQLAGHTVAGWHPRIPVATGSLGHGLPMAAGLALGRRLDGRPGQVFCLTSDGEWQSGSNWEALIFARHHRLDNLTVLVDVNGLQGFGSTEDVASMEPMIDRFRGFGLQVQEGDGHDPESLARLVDRERGEEGPRVVLLRTVKGKGVSFMENRMEWHYIPLDLDHYRHAVADVAGKA